MKRDQVFISYSHKDKKWLVHLQTHLKPYIKNGLDVWDDTRIKPGTKWKDEIAAALARATVAVLLVSPDFLASDFINDNEFPSLLDAARQEGLQILWIAVSASAVQHTELAKYQAAHKNPEVALDRFGKPGLNKVLVSICEVIREAASVPGPPSSLPALRGTDALTDYFADHAAFGDTLHPGASGVAVKNLRIALDWLGYRRQWRTESEYDTEMLETVRKLQIDTGHPNKDGWVGPGTRRLIADRLIASGFDFKRLASVGRRL
jgi:TIR domain